MNVIEFVKVPYEAGSMTFGVNIRVDGRFLAEIMKEVEMPAAKAEGSANIAGGYTAIPRPEHPDTYYLGEHELAWGKNRKKTCLLDCECGQPGCWPLLCEIQVGPTSIAWRDFEQPHRGPDSKASSWDYSHFSGFVFDKQQYFAALANLGISD